MIRISANGVTASIDGIERFVRKAIEAVAGETVTLLERAAEEERVRAEAAWYDPTKGVTRRTGKSGALDVVTTITDREVRVSLVSTDTSRAGSALRAAVVHRPGARSLIDERVTQGEWWEWKNRGAPVGPPGTTGAADWIIKVPNPNASDGKTLVNELIRKPMRARIKVIRPALARSIANRIKR